MDREVESRKYIRKRRRKKLAISFNVAVSVLLAAILLLMVNFISSRYYLRGDWSNVQFYALSDKTLNLLEKLAAPVDVTVFFQRGNPALREVKDLLREYQHASRKISVEYVDPDRDLARADELAHAFGVEQPNVVVFHSDGRSDKVSVDDVMKFDDGSVQGDGSPMPVIFTGEQAFSSAIHRVTQDSRPVAYFLKGHGERDIESFDRYSGYSGIARKIQLDNIDVHTLVLGEQDGIPGDCDVLVIAGPSRRISQPELDIISEYLEGSGRVIILLDAYTRTGLKRVLERWGVRVSDDIVVDATRTLTGRELFITDYGDHPITRAVDGITSVFYSPRAVEPAPDVSQAGADHADRPYVTVLASSSESGWAERDPVLSPMRFDPGVDREGPISVAVAVERGPVPGIDVQIRPTRMVVMGDSSFISNGAMTGGDVDLFMSALNWLIEREDMMAIGPRTIDHARLILSRVELMKLFWFTAAGLPGCAALLGLMVWLRRRR